MKRIEQRRNALLTVEYVIDGAVFLRVGVHAAYNSWRKTEIGRRAFKDQNRADKVAIDNRVQQLFDLLPRPYEVALEVGDDEFAFLYVFEKRW